jgi:hypothetical protein
VAYNGDKTWDELVNEIGQPAQQLLRSIREGQGHYDEWQSFRDGRTNADIATSLGRSETEVAEMDAAFAAFNSITRYQDNDTPPAGIDQGFALRVFSLTF